MRRAPFILDGNKSFSTIHLAHQEQHLNPAVNYILLWLSSDWLMTLVGFDDEIGPMHERHYH